jgi:hypothetical protein
MEVPGASRLPQVFGVAVCDPFRVELCCSAYPGVFAPALTLCDPSRIKEQQKLDGIGGGRPRHSVFLEGGAFEISKQPDNLSDDLGVFFNHVDG